MTKYIDHGPNPYVVNIEDATLANENFRTASWTGEKIQLTLMSIPVGGDVGLEVHNDTDQFLRLEQGRGRVQMGPSKDEFTFDEEVSDDWIILVPKGMWHNVTNIGDEPMKIYSLYAPPHHAHGTIHETQADQDHLVTPSPIVTTTERLYSALVHRDPEAEQQLPAESRGSIAPNGLRLVLANSLQSSGDQVVNASRVLPWLFAALGVPPALTGLLVPIREAGPMLPQAFLNPLILRVRYRKWVFVAGAFIQAIAVAAMVSTAALAEGLTAGVLIVAALAVFALGRCLCSISSKDVQGRTVPKGQRGQVNGLAATAAGLVAVTLGLIIRIVGGSDLSVEQLLWLLVLGVVLWVAVAAVYAGIREPAGEASGRPGPVEKTEPDSNSWLRQMVTLLRED